MLVVFNMIIGAITLVVSVVSLVYVICNVSYPQIECVDFTGNKEMKCSSATIRLTNIGGMLTINKIEDEHAYLNPYDIKIFPSKWRTNEDFVLCLDDKEIPNDFEIVMILSDEKRNVFRCKVKKESNNVVLEIERKFFYLWQTFY